MPNNVQNDVRITGKAEVIERMMREIASTDEKNGDCPFDFEKIIPMPPSLHVESGSRNADALALYAYRTRGDTTELNRRLTFEWVQKAGITTPEQMLAHLQENDLKYCERNPADLTLAQMADVLVYNLREFGVETWYEWSVNHWGTKWNSYSHQEPSFQRHKRGGTAAALYSFDTAWGSPEPIFQALADKYGVRIRVDVSGEVDRRYSYTVEPQDEPADVATA